MIVSQRARTSQTAPHQLDRRASAADTLSPRLRARIAARIHATALDRALAGGVDPAASPALAARAARLTSRRERVALADGLERLLRSAQGRRRRWWALDHHATVLENSSELATLASLRRSERPAYARGIAILNLLLTDGTGPAYRGRAADLAQRLHAAHVALDG